MADSNGLVLGWACGPELVPEVWGQSRSVCLDWVEELRVTLLSAAWVALLSLDDLALLMTQRHLFRQEHLCVRV